MNSLYFDYNATTPLALEVFRAMEPFLREHFANPSSLHQLARKPAQAMREARRRVAALLGLRDESGIVFTSGGTESNNTAIQSALIQNPGKKEIVTSAVEHSSVRKFCQALSKKGYRHREIQVDRDGRLDLENLRQSLSDETAVVSVMMANNETGVLSDLEKIAPLVKERGILFHVDAVQAAGKIPVDANALGADFISLSAHKFYGPKGVGALYVRNPAAFSPLITGGSQERGRRAGTENVAGIAGLGAACELAAKNLTEESARLARLRGMLEGALENKVGDVTVHGRSQPRIANTSFISFHGVDGESLLIALDRRGICVSRGSACMSGSQDPSYVLSAMGVPEEIALSAIRFSFGRLTREEDIHALLEALSEIVPRLRETNVASR